jgi:EmrB/QacA subfamily drug resistance transporter
MQTSRLAPSRPAPGRSPLFLAVILAAQLMVVLDTTIVNVALPHIQQALDFSSSGLSWVLNAYILAFGGFLLLGARAGDLAGRRRVFLGGIALFTASSLAGGLATAGWILLVARAAQGLGAALAAPSALSLLTSVFPEGAGRVRAISLYTTVSAAGAAIGLIVGGLLTEWVSWRWVMFVNVPIGVGILATGRGVLTETPRRQGRFDLVGAVTSTVGMGAIVLGLVEAGTDGWTGGVTVGSFVVGVALLGLFVHTELRAEEPILPLRLLANPARTTANVARGLLYAGMYGMFFFLSLFLQDVQHYSSLRTGLAFLPIPVSVFLASQLTSRVLMARLAQKTVMLSGIGVAALGLLIVSRIELDTSYLELLGSLVLTGIGVGISFVSLTSASLAGVEPGDAGAASGLVNVSQQIGAATGLAVLVTIFATATHHAAIGGAAQAVDPGQFEALLVHGLRTAFGVATLFTAAAFGLVAAIVRSNVRSEATEVGLPAEDGEALALAASYGEVG